MILVGDSLGMVVLDYENTLSVTANDISGHTAAVSDFKLIINQMQIFYNKDQ